MCYTAESATRIALKYAKRRGDADEVEALEKKLTFLQIDKHAYFHVSGFAHPKLIVFTNTNPNEPQLFNWGLIPSWIPDLKSANSIMNQTLNARIETLFNKPSFKELAKNKRCLIYLDAFYEYHHFNKQTYPYRICMQDDSPMVLAGIWDEWKNEKTGEIKNTVSIVTTIANDVMKKIHNNPKADGARMPVILNKMNEKKWLDADDEEKIKAFSKPTHNEILNCYTVGKLLGKNAIGNTIDAEKKYFYAELVAKNELF
jgi:putative SOS response-associated peptidase YedK